MSNVNKEFLCEFIELYKSLLCLWKIKSKEYSNRNKKFAAYEVLVKKLKEIDTEANREAVVKKINNLRSSFRKELKKVLKSIVSGAGSEDIYTPNLWYYEFLVFLSDQETPHASTSSLDDEEHGIKSLLNVLSPEVHEPGADNFELTEDSEILSRPTSSASVTPRTSKKKKKEDPTDLLIAKACAQLEKKEDQFETTGKTIAAKLRCLPNEQRIYAEKLINDVLFEAELGCLNRNYKLVEEPTAKNLNDMEAPCRLMHIMQPPQEPHDNIQPSYQMHVMEPYNSMQQQEDPEYRNINDENLSSFVSTFNPQYNYNN